MTVLQMAINHTHFDLKYNNLWWVRPELIRVKHLIALFLEMLDYPKYTYQEQAL